MGLVGLIFAAFVFIVLPAIAGGQWLNVLTSTGCFTLAVAGCAFMYSRLGMVSLAQVGLMGVGGWVMLRLNYFLDLPFELNLIAAMAVTTLFGWLLALPALRMRGLYLALVTLMAAGGFEILFATFQFPNGGEGFWGVQTGSNTDFRRPVIALSDTAYLRYLVVVVTLGFLVIELHRRMAPGRAWALIRRSEAAAMAAGVNVTYYKAWAFGIAGMMAGLGGGLLAGSLGLLDGGTFKASESVMIFALAVVGGANSWLGVIIAATLFRVLPAFLNNIGVDADLSFVIFGAGLLHAVITAPNGIAGQLVQLINSFLRNVIPGLIAENESAGLKKANALSRLIQTVLGFPALVFASITAGNKSEVSNDTVKVQDILVKFGGVVALDHISADFTKPVSGIIGPNGAGKTTLMNVFSGFVAPATGAIEIDARVLTNLQPHRRSHWGLRRSFQKEEIADDLTVAENVLAQLDPLALSLSQKEAEVERALKFVGLEDKASKPGRLLNTFERRLTDVAKCVVGSPQLIMFDEPAGGMSIEETNRLGDLILKIHDFCGAKTLVIDHDVELITRICEETLVLDFGKKIAFGKTRDVLADPKVRAAYLGIDEEATS